METLDIHEWRIEFNREATIAAYALDTATGPEVCGCDPCRNWALTRKQFMPAELLALLSTIGIPIDREAEVYHNCRLDSGLHSYGAWYHFVGRVVKGEREGALNVNLGSISVYFRTRRDAVSAAFLSQPIVQLELVAEVPWLSDVPESFQ